MEPNDQNPAPTTPPVGGQAEPLTIPTPGANDAPLPGVEFVTPTVTPAPAMPVSPVPTPEAATAHTTPAIDPALEEKLAKAKLAMEGAEHAAKREHEEKYSSLANEQKQLTERLEVIAGEKEKLEIKWVELDERRGEFKKSLVPIFEQEEQIETEEKKIEEEESKIGLERERKIIEEKRRLIEDKRRGIENDKWTIEEKMWKLEDALEENTKLYRTFLDEEDELHRRLEEISQELANA